jgi:hypothetical protein
MRFGRVACRGARGDVRERERFYRMQNAIKSNVLSNVGGTHQNANVQGRGAGAHNELTLKKAQPPGPAAALEPHEEVPPASSLTLRVFAVVLDARSGISRSPIPNHVDVGTQTERSRVNEVKKSPAPAPF